MTRTFLIAALLALAGPAAAMEAPGDYAGAWTLSGTAEGDEVCTLTLHDQPAIGGWAITVPQDCVDKFGLSTDIAAWTAYPNGSIGFIDPLRIPLLIFDPTAIGGYVAHPSEGPDLALDPAAGDGGTELTEAERMSGRWVLTAPGGAVVCAFTLSPAADGMKGRMTQAKPCAATWAKRRMVRWLRDETSIRLIDPNGRTALILGGESLQGFYSRPGTKPDLGFTRDWD